jgi:hypothetical protein
MCYFVLLAILMFLLALMNNESDRHISQNSFFLLKYTGHALPFTMIEPQLFMGHKEDVTSGLLSSVVKYAYKEYESELSTDYRNDRFANVKYMVLF